MRSAIDRLIGHLVRLLGLPAGGTGRAPLTAVMQLIGADLAITAAGFLFTAALIRTIGPAQFGDANVIVSVSQLLLVPLTCGLPTAAARFLADRRAGATIATFAAAQLAVLAVAIPGLWVAESWLSRRLTVSIEFYRWALAYGVILTWQLMVDGVLSGLRDFGRLARFNVIAGVVFIAATAWALLRGQPLDFRDYLALNAVRWFVLIGLGAWFVVRIAGAVQWRQTNDYFRFGLYQSASGLTHFFVLGSIDSLMLNAYHGAAAVGLYGAYYVAFNVVISRLVKVVSGVFLPTATAHDARDRLFRQMRTAYLRLVWLMVPGVAVLSFILFKFYGTAFPFSWTLAALMGICVTLHVGVSVLMDLSAADGIPGVRRNLVAAVITAALNVILNLILIPRWSVGGAIMATAIAFTAGLTYRYVSLVRRYARAAPSA